MVRCTHLLALSFLSSLFFASDVRGQSKDSTPVLEVEIDASNPINPALELELGDIKSGERRHYLLRVTNNTQHDFVLRHEIMPPLIKIEAEEMKVQVGKTVDFKLMLDGTRTRRTPRPTSAIMFQSENGFPFNIVFKFQVTHLLIFDIPNGSIYVPSERDFVSMDFPFQCEAPNLIDRLTISASDKISGRLATTEIVTTESGQRAVRVKVRRSDLGTEVLSGELRLIERVTKAEAVLSLLVSREQEIEVLPALTDFSEDNERCVAHHVIRVPGLVDVKGPVAVDCNIENQTVSAEVTRVSSKLLRVQIRVKKSLLEKPISTDIDWIVRAGNRTLTAKTSFDRKEVTSAVAYSYLKAFWTSAEAIEQGDVQIVFESEQSGRFRFFRRQQFAAFDLPRQRFNTVSHDELVGVDDDGTEKEQIQDDCIVADGVSIRVRGNPSNHQPSRTQKRESTWGSYKAPDPRLVGIGAAASIYGQWLHNPLEQSLKGSLANAMIRRSVQADHQVKIEALFREAPGVVRTWVLDPFSFMPSEVEIKVPKDSKYTALRCSIKWQKLNGVYVPVNAKYHRPIGSDSTKHTLFKFRWHSVNTPLDDAVFDPAQVDSDDFLYRADSDSEFEFANSQ